MPRLYAFAALFCLTTTGCASKGTTDPYLWLEDSKNAQVQPWIKSHNAKSSQALENDKRAPRVADQIRAIITAQDRIPTPTWQAGKVRNFWQDKQHVRGIWRQASLKEYEKANIQWETLLDIDALNKAEGKSWVFKGANCLAPAFDLCLISLSDGGRDEIVVREFQVSGKEFVADGFTLPAAKSDVDWIDKDNLLVATDFGPDTLTTSGYPRQVKIWTRSTPLNGAKLLFEGGKDDVQVSAWTSARPEGKRIFVREGVSFYSEKIFLYEPSTGLQRLPFPESASIEGNFKDFIFARLRDDWSVEDKTIPKGSLVALPITVLAHKDALSKVEIVYTPDNTSTLSQVGFTKDFVELTVLHNVLGEINQISRENGQWSVRKLAVPSKGMIWVASIDAFDPKDRFFATYQSFTAPTTLYLIDGKTAKNPPKVVKQLPAKYDASDVVFDQYQATSKDGTKVPYFVVHKRTITLNGENPTLMYGYGGFEYSLTPSYLGAIGKVWVEKGGIYVLTNIRGGGEFGPRWHEAALKENRQRAYDDFASIAEDLFARKITSPRRLGIMGGSNGGLLVGVAATQHPEYYNAVVCESALLDMLRYTQLPPGASWIGEYGDPADAMMAQVIAKYSPYQNIQNGVRYPKIFFHISTADDRVQPGHTRKMVARLEEKGNDVLLFENTEGGHGGAADLEQKVKKSTLEHIYLYQQLMD